MEKRSDLREEITVRWWMLHNEDLYNLYFTLSIIMVIKSGVEMFLENVASAFKILVRNFKEWYNLEGSGTGGSIMQWNLSSTEPGHNGNLHYVEKFYSLDCLRTWCSILNVPLLNGTVLWLKSFGPFQFHYRQVSPYFFGL